MTAVTTTTEHCLICHAAVTEVGEPLLDLLDIPPMHRPQWRYCPSCDVITRRWSAT